MQTKQILSTIWRVSDFLRDRHPRTGNQGTILALTLLRRLDCLLVPTKRLVLEAQRSYQGRLLNTDQLLRTKSGFSFYNTSPFNFEILAQDAPNVCPNMMNYLQGYSPNVQEILYGLDFFDTVTALTDAGILFTVLEPFARLDLSPARISDETMGSVFEESVRRFAEDLSHSPGDHYSPRDVVRLAVRLILSDSETRLATPGAVATIYDPCCGTGGTLAAAKEHIRTINLEKRLDPPIQTHLFGQELNQQVAAVAKSYLLLRDPHSNDSDSVAPGSTLSKDAHAGRKFDFLIANPPFGANWSRDRGAVEQESTRGCDGRFPAGTPRVNDSQLLFLQHMISHMHPARDGVSRIALLTNAAPLVTGDAGTGESQIRRWILENDWLETLIALPEQLFYTTRIPTYLWLLSNQKNQEQAGKVQLIDATGEEFWKPMRRRAASKHHELTEETVAAVLRLVETYQESVASRILTTRELGYRKVRLKRHDSSEFLRVPLTEEVEDYFQHQVFPYWSDALVDDSYIDSIDGRVGRVGYEIDFNILRYEDIRRRATARGFKEYCGRALLRSVRTSGRFEEDTDAVFVPKTANGKSYLSQAELGTASNYLQLLLHPDGPAIPRYLREFFNSQEGRAFRQAIARGSTAPYIPSHAWTSTSFFLPPRHIQEAAVDLGTELNIIDSGLESIRHEIWREPWRVSELKSQVARLNRGSSLGDWTETLPYPLASILWAAHTSENPYQRRLNLSHFFEGVAHLTATILLSGFKQMPLRMEEERSKIREILSQNNLSAARASFGCRVVVAERLSKTLRTIINSGTEGQEQAKSAFRVGTIEPLRSLSSASTIGILQRANSFRNREIGHSAAPSEPRTREGCEFLEKLVSDYQTAVGDFWELWPLIIPGRSAYDGSIHECSCRRAVGPRTPFEQMTVRLREPAKYEHLHLYDPSLELAFPLVPIVRMKRSPSGDDTCYFFDRLEGAKARFVSFHSADEILEEADVVHEALELMGSHLTVP